MDPLTHALASYTLKRSAFPRAPRATTIAMLLAGTLADLDFLSAYVNPSAYLNFYRTYFHSFIATLLISALVSIPFVLRKPATPDRPNRLFPIFAAAFAAS